MHTRKAAESLKRQHWFNQRIELISMNIIINIFGLKFSFLLHAFYCPICSIFPLVTFFALFWIIFIIPFLPSNSFTDVY